MWILAAVFLSLVPQDDDVRALIEQLRSDKAGEREEAVRRLRDVGQKAVPELEKIVGDPDAEVAARARGLLRLIATFGKITPALRKAVPDIEDVIFSGKDSVCTDIILANHPLIHERPARPELGPAELDVLAPYAVRGAADPGTRRLICRALQLSRLKGGAVELLAYLRVPELRSEAIETLGVIGNRETVRELVPYLHSEDGLVRDRSAEAMVKLGSKELVIARSVELLGHESVDVRRDAAARLGRLGATSAVAALVDRLKDRKENVRQAAIGSLVELEARDRVPELLTVIRKDTEYCKRDAAHGIAWLDAREAIPELIRMLEEPDGDVVGEAADALGLLQAKEAVGPLSNKAEHGESWVRRMAIEALGRIGDPAALPVLLRRLEILDDSLDVLFALGDLDAKPAAPKVVPLLQNAIAPIRQQAALLLAQLQAVEAVPRIVPLLKDPDPQVGKSAIQALGLLNGSEAAAELEKRVTDGEAILALARMGRRAAVGPLLQARAPVEKGGLYRFDNPPDRDMLTAMNRFVNPEAFRKLLSITVRRIENRTTRKSRRAEIREIEKLHGLKIEIDAPLDTQRLDKIPVGELCELSVTPLAEFLKTKSGGEILLVGDRILLVPEKKAYAHWKAWWAAEQNK